MKILVVTQYFWPETFRVNDLVSDLVRRGHQVTVLTGLPNYPEGEVFPQFRKEPEAYSQFEGAEIIRVPLVPRGKRSLTLLLNYASFVVSGVLVGSWRLRARTFDHVLAIQLSPVTAVLPALWLGRLKRLPVTMWILDLWPESLSAIGAVKSPTILKWVGKLVSFIYRRCDRILVQSQAFLPNIQKYGGDLSKVEYFPGWAEPLFLEKLENASPCPEMEPFQGTFNVMFAGNIGEAQDFPAILDAAEALADEPSLRWIVLGDGRASQLVREEILRRGLSDKVIMLGRHPIERMPSFFRAADALLVSLTPDPIFAMTIPGKIQSYLAAGLPILGMLDGEGARVIQEAQAGLIAPAGQGRELADRVRHLLAMSEREREDMGHRGQAYCDRMFNRERLISSLESSLQAISSGAH